MEEFFKHDPNTGTVSFSDFEILLSVKYKNAIQTEDEFHFPVLFYSSNSELVAYYDLERHCGFIS